YEQAVLSKEQLLQKLPGNVGKDELMSNVKLVQVLESLGVEVPRKISPATGQPTPALAKNDPQWKDLVEEYEDDPKVSAILAARTGVKSTLIETRALKLAHLANNYPKFRVPLRYYAAHPGRLGGMEG